MSLGGNSGQHGLHIPQLQQTNKQTPFKAGGHSYAHAVHAAASTVNTHCNDFIGADGEPDATRLVHVHTHDCLLKQSEVGTRSSTAQTQGRGRNNQHHHHQTYVQLAASRSPLVAL